MAAIKGKGNRSTEVRLRFALVRAGIRGWRIGVVEVEGKPDFWFAEEQVAVFVDGCFWHGCPDCGRVPKTNPEFWKAKAERNRDRDLRVSRKLRRNGVLVVRFWEHFLRDDVGACVEEIERILERRREL